MYIVLLTLAQCACVSSRDPSGRPRLAEVIFKPEKKFKDNCFLPQGHKNFQNH